MKIIINFILVHFFLLQSINIYAQVGIGTLIPNASSLLDISSTSKGLLMPRLTTTERNNIILPATGLMIFNTTLNDSQLNTGTPSTPIWTGIKHQDLSLIESVNKGDNISTTSASDLLVPDMTASPMAGTYLVSFSAQHSSVVTSIPFSSAQGVIDAEKLYNDLSAYTGGTTHASAFANETLSPGVYNVAAAISITGTITLAGGSTTANPVFIIRATGAFTTGVGATVLLTGNAKPENIFWVSDGAISTAANTTMKGTMVGSAGAMSLGADTNLEGRMITKLGAITLGSGAIIKQPTGISPVDLGLLSTFAMWSSAGAVSDVANSNVTGDVGTGLGALTMLGAHSGVQYPAGTIAPPSPPIITDYSIYLKGVEVVNSSRKIYSENGLVYLQAKVTSITDGDAIEIRWNVDSGKALLDNRTLSLIRSGY
jgi:hypothetical protein